MKKLLSLLLIISGFVVNGQNLVVNGTLSVSDPAFSGTLKIYNGALNQINFNHSFFGDFLIVGSGNGWNSGSFSIASRIRGAAFSSSTTNVPALQTEYGLVRLNLYDGRTLIGQNVPDDGFSLLQVHAGAKFDSLRISGDPGVTGDVLTRQTNGTYRPQTPSAGGGTNLYNSNGYLTGARSLSGVGQPLDFGTPTSHLGQFRMFASYINLVADNTITLNGLIQYNEGGNANVGGNDFTIGPNYPLVLLSTLTANHTVTLPTTNTGYAVLHILNQNNNGFHWNIVAASGTIKNLAGTTISVVPNAATMNIMMDGTNYIVF